MTRAGSRGGASRARRSVSPAAGEQLVRILTLVPFLHARGAVDVAEAAALLGVGREQVVADLKVLFMCGLPGGYPDDLIDVDIEALEGDEADGVIRVSNADYLDRPLRLSPTEASAMIVAVRALRSGAGEQTRDVVDRVLRKLEAAAATGPNPTQVEPGEEQGSSADEALLARRLESAARDQKQVRLRYWVPSRDEVSDRVVDPRGIVSSSGAAYLDAYCHSAEAPRLFRLDRVQDAEVLDSPVATAPVGPRTLDGPLFGAVVSPGGQDDGRDGRDGSDADASAPEVSAVRVRLAPAARWVTEYYPVYDVLERGPAPGLPDGAVECTLPVADQRWLTRLLLRLAPHAEVLDPSGAARRHAAAVRDTEALYTG